MLNWSLDKTPSAQEERRDKHHEICRPMPPLSHGQDIVPYLCRSLQVHKSGPRSTFKLFRVLFDVQQHKAHRAKIKLCRRSICAWAVTDGNGQLWKVYYSLQRWFGIIKNTGQKRRRWIMREQPKYNYSVLLDGCHGHQSGYFWLRYHDRR